MRCTFLNPTEGFLTTICSTWVAVQMAVAAERWCTFCELHFCMGKKNNMHTGLETSSVCFQHVTSQSSGNAPCPFTLWLVGLGHKVPEPLKSAISFP